MIVQPYQHKLPTHTYFFFSVCAKQNPARRIPYSTCTYSLFNFFFVSSYMYIYKIHASLLDIKKLNQHHIQHLTSPHLHHTLPLQIPIFYSFPQPPFQSPPKDKKLMSTTTPKPYKFNISWSESSLVITKGGFTSFDAALSYSQILHSLYGYDLLQCDRLGEEKFGYYYTYSDESGRDKFSMEKDYVCKVVVGPEE